MSHTQARVCHIRDAGTEEHSGMNVGHSGTNAGHDDTPRAYRQGPVMAKT